MNPKIIIIDGTSFIYRAFYAVRDLGTSHIATNAIYGFVAMIKTLQKRYKNAPMVCVFDSKGSNFRHELYPEYKAHRPSPPAELLVQLPYIYRAVQAFGIPVLSREGLEADDIIGSLAVQYAQRYEGDHDNTIISMVHILTGDKDFAQIVSPDIHLYNSMTDELLDESAVVEKFGVRPSQIIDYLVLIGDSVDNIPGVMKCGPVTARKWLNQYGDLDNLIANKDKLTGTVGENFRKAIDWLHTAKRLVTINCALDLNLIQELDLNKIIINQPDYQNLYELYSELRFNRWLIELKKESGLTLGTAATSTLATTIAAGEATVTAAIAIASNTVEEFIQHLNTILSRSLDSSINVIFDIYNNHDSNAIILELAYQDQDNKKIIAVLPLPSLQKPTSPHPLPDLVIKRQEDLFDTSNMVTIPTETAIANDNLFEKLAQYLMSAVVKTTFNAKSLYYFLTGYFQVLTKNLPIINQLYDLSLLAYVVDSSQKLDLAQLFSQYYYDSATSVLQIQKDHKFVLESYFAGKSSYSKVDQSAQHDIIQLFSLTSALHQALRAHLTPTEQKLYLELELPLTRILVEMEQLGIKINVQDFRQMETEISARLQVLEQNIYQAAGCVFNINSPKQLQDILYHKLGAPTAGIAKNETGYSTDEQSLQLLAQQGIAIASVLLEYRYLAKILNTYIVALPKMVDEAARLHTSFEQTSVISGRLSSRNPNLQNIPVKHEYGQRIGNAFIVDSGYQLLKADYSQIELRLLAYFSQDQYLQQSFAARKDIHAATAMQIFNKTEAEEVSKEERRYAKTVNFGIIYGQSAFSLAKELGISNGEAKEYIRRYFAQFPEVQNFIQHTHEQAVANGYVETLYGRRIYLKQINSKNYGVKQGQLRLAVNAILQGSAADIIKVAMIRIADYFRKNRYNSAMLLQVHDELVFQIADNEASIVNPVIPDLMTKDFPLELIVNTNLK